MVNVVQIGKGDLVGGRFNGFAIRHLLAERQIQSRCLVFERTSDDPTVSRMLGYPGSRSFVAMASNVERRLGFQSMLQAHSFGLPANSAFRRADVAHYHIIHDGFFSLAAMPVLSRLKPTVWTFHDPWIMTGHCIYPMECERWRIGCGECPDLGRPMAMDFDNTRRAFAFKRLILQATPCDIVVASRWMMAMALDSPIARNARLHHIPFGVDLARFTPQDSGPARAALGVRPGHLVVAVRGNTNPFKGVEEMARALERVQKPVCLISMQDDGHFDHLIGRHQVIGLDWSDDEELLIRAYTAADVFVMPSTAEAFGMMAIEAMACGKPVLVFEGTSLPEIVFAPEAGLAVPMRNIAALAEAIDYLATHEEDRLARGRRSRWLAEQHYSAELYADRLSTLYRDVAAGRTIGRGGGEV